MQTFQVPRQFALFPPVIKNLLIINGIVYLAQQTPAIGEMLLSWAALWPLATRSLAAVQGFEMLGFMPWQLLTYSFLHGSLTHLFFNMFALWMFGVSIERSMGSRRFLFYYFFAVVGAGLVQLVVASLSGGIYPTIGASGGVMGILLAFGMFFPNAEILLLIPPIPLKAKYMVALYAAFDLFAGVTGTQQGVANFAHLGGMAFGLLLILYWRGKLPLKPGSRR